MNRHDAATLASKLFGLYCIIQSLGYLSGLGMQLSLMNAVGGELNRGFILTLTSLSFGVTAMIGIFMMSKGDWVATRLLGQSGTADEGGPAGIAKIQSVGFSLVGLLVIVQALPRFFNNALNILFTIEGWMYRSGLSPQAYIDLAEHVLALVLGFWLLLGASGLARMLGKIRGEVD